MYSRSRSINSNKTDNRSADENGLAGPRRRTWMNSLQLLSCVVPTQDEKTWDDVPQIDDTVQKNKDNRLLPTRSVSSSSSSLQQERRQSASPSSTATDSQENRHKASPSRFELYEKEFMTPPSSASQNRAIMSSYRNNNEFITTAKTTTVVTPEQHNDFIQGVFDTARTRSSLKYASEHHHHRQQRRNTHATYTTKTTNRILLPVLDELSEPNEFGERQEVSLIMRRESNPFCDWNDRGSEVRNIETRKLIASACGELYEPGCSVKTLTTRSPRAADVKYSDEWRLLQEAKQEIASVKEFLRMNSIRNETNDFTRQEEDEEAETGIETLLLNDDHVAVMEESLSLTRNPSVGTRAQRRVSFGDKPPRPPHSPHEYTRYQRFEF